MTGPAPIDLADQVAALTAECERLRGRLADSERNRQGERDSREREQRKAWNLDTQLTVTRAALRGALEAVPALERRRDELLVTANRYLERSRRLRAALFRYRVHFIACEGTDYLDGAVGDDATEDALVSAIEKAEPY